MKTKTKIIIGIIVAALVALGYFFINTTAQIELVFKKVGIAAIIILIIALAVFAIIMVNKASKAKAEHDEKKAKRKAREEKKAEE